jgi:hypothetical protein
LFALHAAVPAAAFGTHVRSGELVVHVSVTAIGLPN